MTSDPIRQGALQVRGRLCPHCESAIGQNTYIVKGDKVWHEWCAYIDVSREREHLRRDLDSMVVYAKSLESALEDLIAGWDDTERVFGCEVDDAVAQARELLTPTTGHES